MSGQRQNITLAHTVKSGQWSKIIEAFWCHKWCKIWLKKDASCEKNYVKVRIGNRYALWPSFMVFLVELIPPQKVVYASKPKFSHYFTSRFYVIYLSVCVMLTSTAEFMMAPAKSSKLPYSSLLPTWQIQTFLSPQATNSRPTNSLKERIENV